MHLILHDLPPEAAQQHLPPQDGAVQWFAAAPGVKHCVGCFGCWLKTPGECVIPDRGQAFCRLLARADKLTVVSRCYYGGFSPDVKALIDRHIGYMLPWFHVNEGEMHHVPRYERRMELAWHLYGSISQAERETALRYSDANARNMHTAGNTVTFYASAEELEAPGAKGCMPEAPPVSRPKVAFINGSPRKGKVVSAILLEALEERLPGCEIVHGWGEACGAYVFAFPLYVDGIPSHLLRELVEHEQGLPPGARVYAMVNNGFYEGEQNAAAISMLRNWCARAGLVWGQGLGIGAGEVLKRAPIMAMAAVLARGSLKKFNRALDTLAGHILAGGGGEAIYTRPGMPRWLYIFGGDASFRSQGRKNGLAKREMERRLS